MAGIYSLCLFALKRFHLRECVSFPQVLSQVPVAHRNVFKYVCAFLRELLSHSTKRGLDTKLLGKFSRNFLAAFPFSILRFEMCILPCFVPSHIEHVWSHGSIFSCSVYLRAAVVAGGAGHGRCGRRDAGLEERPAGRGAQEGGVPLPLPHQ